MEETCKTNLLRGKRKKGSEVSVHYNANLRGFSKAEAILE